MVAVGLLVALTTGLCSLTFTALFIVNSTRVTPESQIVIAFIAIGFLVSAFGAWLFRRGLARLRKD
jgi:hypothetical protein